MKKLVILDFCGTIYSNQSTRDISYFFFFNKGFNKIDKRLRKKLFSIFFQFVFLLLIPKRLQIKTISRYIEILPGNINYKLIDKYKKHKVIISSAGIYELIEAFCKKYIDKEISIIQAPKLINNNFLKKIKDFILIPHTGKIKKMKLKNIIKNNIYQEIIFETDSKNDFEVSQLDLKYIEIPSRERFK